MFAPRVAAEEELKAAQELQARQPKKAEELAKLGHVLVSLAERGDLEGLRVHYLSQRKRIMYWFVVKAFQAALLSGHLNIAQHMLDNGVDLRHNQWKDLLISCIEQAIDDCLARDLTTLLVRYELDINHQRRKDYFTALHVACVREFPLTINALIGLGADVNAVAAQDMMPLLVIHQKMQDRDIAELAEEKDALSMIFAALEARGAKLTWRRDHLRTQAQIANLASSDNGDDNDDDDGNCYGTDDAYVFDTSVANTDNGGHDMR